MPEKETKHIEEISERERMQMEFREFLSAGEVHDARKILKKAEEKELKLDFSGEEYKAAAENAVMDSFRKGHVRHADRLLAFATENKILVDLSGDEMKEALSEGFELCGPQKKEEILEFAKQNQIEINTSLI